MADTTPENIQHITSRLDYLEESLRFTQDSLEMAAAMGDFQTSINQMIDPQAILAETGRRLSQIIPTAGKSFFLFRDDIPELEMASASPQDFSGLANEIKEEMIENGTVAWALGRKKAVFMWSDSAEGQVLIHALSTSSRIRGVCIALLSKDKKEIYDSALSLLTVLMLASANALESYELYSMIRDMNSDLRSNLDQLTKSQARLQLMAQVFNCAQEGVVITDENGIIQDVNQAFSTITGYSREDALGKTPAILRSGRQDPNFYAEMWNEIKNTGHWSGQIWNRRKDKSVYPQHLSISTVRDLHQRPLHFVGFFHDISLRLAQEERIRFHAFHDALTGLPNRILLQDRIELAVRRATRTSKKIAVLFFDLDNFKSINDTLGHSKGDQALKIVAERLCRCMRDEDTVARLGGDEFVVTIENIDSEKEALSAAIRARDALGSLFTIDGMPMHVSSSVGISIFPDDGSDPDKLIQNADLAMYRAKETGKGRCQMFTPGLQKEIQKKLTLERDLRRAIERKEFEVYYQPVIDFHSEKIIAFEALARWKTPAGKPISPASFIPVAEEMGIIDQISRLVTDQALKSLESWHREGFDIGMGINISARQLEDESFAETIQDIVSGYDVDPGKINLEVTETALMKDMNLAVSLLQQLSKNGFKLYIDDFGTGHSSLYYLKRLPIDVLKIDRSFVEDLQSSQDSQSIVHTIISMAKSMQLSVLAEGVETAEQLAFLKTMGCNLYQGFLFSRPVPFEQASKLLTTNIGNQES